MPLAPRLRILHVVTRFRRAGTEENTAITCNGQIRQGHTVRLLSGHEHVPSALEMLDPEVEVQIASYLTREIHPLADLAALLELIFSIRKFRPDVVHTHQSKAGFLGRIAAAICGVPFIVHGVHILPFMGKRPSSRMLYTLLERLALPLTSMFIYVTPALHKQSIEAGLHGNALHLVIPSGMDINSFRQAKPLTVLNGITPDDHTLLLYVASLEPRKQHAALLDTFAVLAEEHPGLILLLAGEGPEERLLRAQAQELNISHRVVFLGSRDDVPELISTSDVCIFSSSHEGLPRAVIQYVAGGKPVVSTRLPDIDRVVFDGQNGNLVPPSDLRAMLGPLRTLIASRATREAMGRHSASVDLSAWDAAHMVKLMGSAYAEMLARGHAGTRPQRHSTDLSRDPTA